jgi:hypothetical protein
MSVTSRLVFNPTDADSRAASSNVGAYVRAGNDGDVIASQNIAAEEWLNVAAALHDGSGNAIGSTGGSLDVNVTNSFTVNDAALADTAIAAGATAVSAALIDPITTALSNRKYAFFANEGNKSLYLGTTGTTAATGYPLHPGMQIEMRAGASIALKVIGEASASAESLRYLELS